MRSGDIPQWKKEKVEEIAAKIKAVPVVGILDLRGVPSKQLLQIKQSLREEAEILMSKKRLMQRALKSGGLDSLNPYLEGQPAFIFSNTNPFKLSMKLQESRTSTPAKAGDKMPKDITVPAGETPFAPGPIVGELGIVGIKAAIEGGKVVIKEDGMLAKEGDVINDKTAGIMAKLGIEPMEIGLKLVAAHENGLVFTSDVLSISTEETLEKLSTAASSAFNLAFNIGYPTKDNIKLFISEAFRKAKGLALEVGYMCSATVKELLGTASAEADALKAKLPEAPAEGAPAEEKSEEAPAEESKEAAEAEAKPAEETPKEEVKAEKLEEKKEEVPKEEVEAPKEPEVKEEKKEEAPKKEEKPAEEKPEEPKAEEAPKEEKAEPPAAEEKEE